MSPPLAKGIIITLSLLCAAGIAIYENPHVKEWIEDSRRKVEMAFRDISHDLSGIPREPSSRLPRDASATEEDGPEAVERRRRVRQEILERGRQLEQRRRSKETESQQSKSIPVFFSDFVDGEGVLKTQASTTLAETVKPEDVKGLRNRRHEATGAALGAALANPFSDEMHILDTDLDAENESGVQTPTRLSSPPLPPKPAAYHPDALAASNDFEPVSRSVSHADDNFIAARAPSAKDSAFSDLGAESALDLTPTTSATPSMLDFDLETPAEHTQPIAASQLAQFNSPSPAQQSFWSVNEWAAQQRSMIGGPSSAAPLRSPPALAAAGVPAIPLTSNQGHAIDLERAMSDMILTSSRPGSSVAIDGEDADLERVSRIGSEDARGHNGWDSEDDDGPGISTPGSWTDVGSTVSHEL